MPDDNTETRGLTQRGKSSPNTSSGIKKFTGQELVQPGQSDTSLAAFLKGMMRQENRKLTAVSRIYAGILGATSPQIDDFANSVDQAVAYQAWYKSCTEKQIKILNYAKAERLRLQNKRDRKEYAVQKLADTGQPVRGYTRDRSDTEKRAMDATRQQRRRDKMKLEKAKADVAHFAYLDAPLSDLGLEELEAVLADLDQDEEPPTKSSMP